jgi:hypothetical protein
VQAFATACLGLHQFEAACNKTSASARQEGRKRPAEEDGSKKRRRVVSVNLEEDGTGRKPHFQTARFTPFSDRR